MYYESKKDRQKDKLIVFILLIIIIALLAILILKLDYNKEATTLNSNYEATKLSTEIVQNVDKQTADIFFKPIFINSVIDDFFPRIISIKLAISP